MTQATISIGPPVNHSSTAPQYVPGMDGMQTLAAVQALRDLLDNQDRDDWEEIIAANRALIKVIETGEPMTRRLSGPKVHLHL
jgi:hypothetical protein